MNRHNWLVLVPLVMLGCGDFDLHPIPLVNQGPTVPARADKPERHVSSAPATKESAARVLQVGQRLIIGNPQIGLRPLFITVGVPEPEVFHKGGQLGNCQVVVSEGLVRQCPSDGQLAAVLALELGKLVSERESLSSPASRKAGDRLPPSEAIGTDSSGTFGSSDGTRMMELAHREKRRKEEKEKEIPAGADGLARKYLTRAGYEATSLDEVAALLRKTEDHNSAEKLLGDSLPVPPPPPSPDKDIQTPVTPIQGTTRPIASSVPTR